jgi:hypothetical protein
MPLSDQKNSMDELSLNAEVNSMDELSLNAEVDSTPNRLVSP